MTEDESPLPHVTSWRGKVLQQCSWPFDFISHAPFCTQCRVITELTAFQEVVTRNYRYQLSQLTHSVVSDSLQPHGMQHVRPSCPSPTPRPYSNSWPVSRWLNPTISSFVVPFSSHRQSFTESKSFQMSPFFTSGGKSIGVSASTSVLPMNIQDWFPLGWTGWISVQSKGLSRVFSNTTVQKHEFFGTQLSLQYNSHTHTWLLEKA